MTMSVNAIHDFTGRGETRSATLRIAPQADEALAGVEAPQQQSFGHMVKEFAGDVNALQFEAGHAIDQFVTGEAADVHQVMVAVEQAGIAMDLMLEIRNRVLDGYQELIRMQV
jgi:flagellar hook-basal body complex protein FliE